LLQLAQWEESHDPNIARSAATIDSIYTTLDAAQPHFLNLYSQCLEKHPHPKIYYERGMVLFHQGKALDSLDDIRALIGLAQQNHQDLLTSKLYLQEGTVYAELGLYDKAVVSLSEAIHRDPNNSPYAREGFEKKQIVKYNFLHNEEKKSCLKSFLTYTQTISLVKTLKQQQQDYPIFWMVK
jgi:tetratricopeptide (TPR) repeat protein